ncbi:hypothetical protein ACU8DI_10225 [Psychroserpens sp. BH13MA-6]
MRISLTITMFVCTLLVFPQQQKRYFDTQIDKHLRAYNRQSETAIQNGDSERAEFLYDSLFNNHLKSSYLRDFKMNKVNGGHFNTAKLDRPFLLVTKSAWEKIDEDEIKEINRMSKMYKGQVEIIILFWDTKLNAKARSKDYNSNVTITYIDERDNDANHIIRPFKHSFGAPACFFFSETKQLMKIDRKFAISKPDAHSEIAFHVIHEDIKKMIFEEGPTQEGMITTLQ